MKKDCSEHGKFQEIYWSDYEQYQRAEQFRCEGDGVANPRTETKLGCPLDCGICPQHKSHTGLAIIDVTNRCNLHCPVCFANAAAAGYVYEPSKKEIQGMLENFRRNKPVPAPALQFSGGEPTIRKDLFELIRSAKELGFEHVEVNTNGLRLAQSVKYCRGLKEAGVSTVYLQFDGLTSDVYEFTRGCDLLDVKMRALENCRKVGIGSIVLVVTLVKGVNDHQLGDIIRFAIKNFDVIRCVNVQPVSLCGRLPEEERAKMRITIPDFMNLVEEQTDGKIKVSDFYPVPIIVPISKAVGALKGKRYVEFTAHPHCGMATYVFIDEGEMVPITRYGNVEKFVETMEKVYEMASKGHKKLAGAGKYVRKRLETIMKNDPEIKAFMKRVGMFVSGVYELPEIREVTPGHLVRSGYSSSYDVNFGKEAGAAAVILLTKGLAGNTVVKVMGTKIFYKSTAEVIKQRRVDLNIVAFYEKLGVCFGRTPAEYKPELLEETGMIQRSL